MARGAIAMRREPDLLIILKQTKQLVPNVFGIH